MKDLSVNKRAGFDYEISEKLFAGIQLTGHEAKSVKMGRVDIAGAHAIERGGELFLIGMKVPPFQPKNVPAGYETERTKKLLLNRDEIKVIIGKIGTGLTLVPLRVYTERGFVKVELGLGKGRKKRDKRELIKKRETEREIRGHVGL
ncbi:MAG: SsrA-binding protein [Candidatus Jorgensenbacteria bacterium GW2011_GWA1_48_13]|uniref:SsrA-binding protein n=2 Tax=Candidatus Joergenseniibacteriota TaxID=1752739 RepID=A0A0G1W9R7_9BACT|nr:MAG: SsrA-binding protein [Candidatus Jorgensenbacteria bacterium GW2011_GWA1_48_13]KKU98837.1 MAG: SsrA-binding protein, SsrA-binding protein [Candidatus Jorgensenbacteria bacterium GW2011_GWC1_48_8]KKW15330.1 MAG: SsrA-binding protein [Candidatus Jorgensenbacteria bacterium GW2011_GWB1_50_10]